MTSLSGPDGLSRIPSGRRLRIVTALVLAVVLLATVGWYIAHPAPLPVRAGHVTAATSPGRPVFVGVFTPSADFDRTLRMGGVHVHTTATAPVTVTPLLCTGGSIGVTTDPSAFCDDVSDPADGTLRAGDSILIEIEADEPTAAFVDPVGISYREGLQVGTQSAGTAVVINITPVAAAS
ncbi:hypothetical protein [Nocardioides acrostichi]|uniref:Uncharacterized protein n=1 Tax=Nocardioides acrostichi TaxID=2784339 RepID=A0A930V350_9ACTN|nr:hypothetical protein [Nocardioides acrostichi]MBF4162870.1 hypothetical protein [Nocardioides acrostichi]